MLDDSLEPQVFNRLETYMGTSPAFFDIGDVERARVGGCIPLQGMVQQWKRRSVSALKTIYIEWTARLECEVWRIGATQHLPAGVV